MADVPTYDFLMLPLLQYAADGNDHHIRDAIDNVAARLGLTDKQLNELVPSGRKTKYYDRMHWAKTYLSKAGLLESTGRGTFRITDRGQQVLMTEPEHINKNILMQFPEFQEFQSRSTVGMTASQQTGIVDSSTETPLEIIEREVAGLRESLAAELLDYVLSVTPQFFEQLVVDLLLAMGYGGSLGSGTRLGQSGDEGIDGVIQEDKLGLDTICIQAKRWARDRTIGRPVLQGFVGSLVGQGATRGVFITTSSFTREAVEFAQKMTNHKLILIDGHQLAKLMIEHDVGVSVERKYIIKKVDENYFQDV